MIARRPACAVAIAVVALGRAAAAGSDPGGAGAVPAGGAGAVPADGADGVNVPDLANAANAADDVNVAGGADGARLAPGEVIVIDAPAPLRTLSTGVELADVLAAAELATSGARTVAAALRARAALWIESGLGGQRVSMHGLGPAYVLVIVDGVRQIGRVDGAIDLDRLATRDVDRVEIVRGPGSARYGADALAGVIAIETRAPTRTGAALRGRYDARGGTDGAARLTGAVGRWGAALDGEWRRAPAFDRSPAQLGTTGSAVDDRGTSARVIGRRDDGATLDLWAAYQQLDRRGVDAYATGAVIDRRNLTELGSLSLRARHPLGDRGLAQAQLTGAWFRDQYLADQRGAASLDRDEDTREHALTGAVAIERALGQDHRLGVGVEGEREALRSPRLVMAGARHRLAAFVEDGWRRGGWRLVPAIRVDHDSQFGTHASPRLAVRWDPHAAVALRASIGRGYRAPSFKELLLRFENPAAGYVVDGNPALGPETSTGAQVGAELALGPNTTLTVAAHDDQLRGLIAIVSSPTSAGLTRFGYANLGRARTTGADAHLSWTRGRLAVDGQLAYERARDRDADRALEGVPTVRATGAARWDDRAEQLTASVELALTGPRPYYPDDVTWTGARVELRARITKTIAPLTYEVGVDNALDAGDDRYDPIAPRTLYAGADAVF